MASPPVSPSRQQTSSLQGSSRVTGGILRGRALGNVFNNAEACDVFGSEHESRIGRVQIYTVPADPTTAKPNMELKHEVTPKLIPVLKALGRKYSPVRSKISNLLHMLEFDVIFLDENRRVFLYEDSVWNIKGRYETAMEDDEPALWVHEDGVDLLRILVVSTWPSSH